MKTSRTPRRRPRTPLPSPRRAFRGQSAHRQTIRARVDALRDKLSGPANAAALMDEFFYGLGCDLRFHQEGEVIEDEALLSATIEIAAEAFGAAGELIEATLCRLPEHRLTHGALLSSEWLGTLLFFEDQGEGLLALCPKNLRGPTVYARFSLQRLPALPSLPC